MSNFRIGFGYDVHQLQDGLEFWLGGIRLEHQKGALGHSDADVLVHVICDAILGGGNLRDIGYHFSDTDPQFKGVDSKLLLSEVMRVVREEGKEMGKIDTLGRFENPKSNSFI